MRSSLVLCLLVLLSACTMQPPGLQTVETLDTQRYMGKWFEIARLDHRFERGLEKVSAEYALREDGAIAVTNRGFNTAEGEWEEADGVARFREGVPNGRIKVTFFWPFYGGYNIVELDPEYRYVLIIGPDTSYGWILAREPVLETAVYERLMARAKALGVAESGWIKVAH